GVLEELAVRHGKHLVEWSVTRGLRRIGGARGALEVEAIKEPLRALEAAATLGQPALVVFKDLHAYLDQAPVIRGLRDLAHQLKASYSTVILLSPVLRVPVELEKEVTVLDVPLPGPSELLELLREIVQLV